MASKNPRPVHICNCGNHSWASLTRGYVTVVSPQDSYALEEKAWHACISDAASKIVYARDSDGNFLHRVILGLNSKLLGDHKNGNGLDNRRDNLRPSTCQQNLRNGRAYRSSSSKFRGVRREKRRNKWVAGIVENGVRIYLGQFELEEEAARAYDTEAIKRYGEFSRPNFPQA